MISLIKLFWSICCLKATPKDVPYSVEFLLVLVSFNLLLGFVGFSFAVPWLQAFSQAVIATLSTSLYTYFVLSLKKLGSRFVQTYSALVGVSVIINFILLPIVILQFYLHPTFAGDILTPLAKMSLIMAIIVNLWVISIMTHIYRHALNLNKLAALLVTLGGLSLNVLTFNVWLKAI